MNRRLFVVGAIALLAWRPAADACTCARADPVLSPANGAVGVPNLGQGGCTANNFPVMANPRIAGALAAVDWAGNRSQLTSVRVLKGCGCSSTDALLPFAALLLLTLRRGYRATSGQ